MKGIKLGTYPYTYARVCHMRSVLLKKEDYHKLLKMSLSEIIAFFESSLYKSEIDMLAQELSGIDLIEVALNRNLASTYKKLLRISSGYLRQLIGEYLKRKDVEDIKTILRAVFVNESPKKLKTLIQGAGTLSYDYLIQLSKLGDIEQIIAQINIFSTAKLKEAYASFKSSQSLLEIETALDNAYYSNMLELASQLKGKGGAFSDFLKKEIEIVNLLTLLRLKKERIEKKDIHRYLFSLERYPALQSLLDITSIGEAAKILERVDYSSAVKKGLEAFEKKNSLIELETSLYNYLFNKSISLSGKFPMFLNTILGYMFLKEMEIRNLRILLKGKQLNLSSDFIEGQLVVKS